MINLQLTDKEWYFICIQLGKITFDNPHNHVAKAILEKIMNNTPKFKNMTPEFAREYEVNWIE